mmetsp:Transcript_26278/g.55238  ORF Transcript_26278/g.55238 Transcript_26278/m.55238 type:complete len:84 (+) Transcript_26278:671-922(+)
MAVRPTFPAAATLKNQIACLLSPLAAALRVAAYSIAIILAPMLIEEQPSACETPINIKISNAAILQATSNRYKQRPFDFIIDT